MTDKNTTTKDRQPSGLEKLNGALFDQLDRLNDPGLAGEELEQEMKRAHSVTSVSKEIVANARTALDAEKFRAEMGSLYKMPSLLESKG